MRRMRSVKAWFMVNTSALLIVLVAGCFASTCHAAGADQHQIQGSAAPTRATMPQLNFLRFPRTEMLELSGHISI